MPTSPRKTRAVDTKASASAPADAATPDHDALLQALRRLTEPLAALSVARGLPYATVEEIVKRSFVDAARAAQPDTAGSRLVSRISTATGLNRREVARLTQREDAQEAARRSPATQLFTRWLADPKLKTRKGEFKPLPRQGAARSFDALARSVTSDVHPRSLLDELCRLGLAREEGDMVHLVQRSFVPGQDSDRMLGFLGSNVGDHLRAAVSNVLSSESGEARLPEQAVFADQLSQGSVEEVARLVRLQWQSVLDATVPRLQALIESDANTGAAARQRVRIGLYMYAESVGEPRPDGESPEPEPEADPPAQRKRRAKDA